MSIRHMDGKKIHPNDKDPSEIISVKYIDLGKEFSFNERTFGLGVTIGKTELKTCVIVYGTGMVCFEVENDCDLEGDSIRYAVREIYFAMKNLYHRDIHHSTDETGSTTMKYGDDNFSVVVGDTIEDAVRSIFSKIIDKCENNLRRYRMMKSDDSLSYNTMYLLTAGFITYGRNFISTHKPIIGKEYDRFAQSLDCCAETLHSLDYNARNASNYKLANSTKEITYVANQISMRMILLTFLSIAVAFFAGSIFADALIFLNVEMKIAITIVASIVVLILGHLIWSWKPKSQ